MKCFFSRGSRIRLSPAGSVGASASQRSPPETRFSPAGSVGASASQRSPPETRTPQHAPRASVLVCAVFWKRKKTPLLRCIIKMKYFSDEKYEIILTDYEIFC